MWHCMNTASGRCNLLIPCCYGLCFVAQLDDNYKMPQFLNCTMDREHDLVVWEHKINGFLLQFIKFSLVIRINSVCNEMVACQKVSCVVIALYTKLTFLWKCTSHVGIKRKAREKREKTSLVCVVYIHVSLKCATTKRLNRFPTTNDVSADDIIVEQWD